MLFDHKHLIGETDVCVTATEKSLTLVLGQMYCIINTFHFLFLDSLNRDLMLLTPLCKLQKDQRHSHWLVIDLNEHLCELIPRSCYASVM